MIFFLLTPTTQAFFGAERCLLIFKYVINVILPCDHFSFKIDMLGYLYEFLYDFRTSTG